MWVNCLTVCSICLKIWSSFSHQQSHYQQTASCQPALAARILHLVSAHASFPSTLFSYLLISHWNPFLQARKNKFSDHPFFTHTAWKWVLIKWESWQILTNLTENRENSAGKDKNQEWQQRQINVEESTERETLCAAVSSAMLLNYWCCFRTPKCETRKDLCIINIYRQPELGDTSVAVSSSSEMICKELKHFRRTRRFHLHREIL